MMQRLAASNNPHLILMGYDRAQLRVTNLAIVPKYFFTPDIIEERKPLASTARRAGWVGCNILLDRVPDAGKIYVVQDGSPIPKQEVLAQYRQTAFLREQKADARGWLLEVLRCVDDFGASEFDLSDIYAFESRLQAKYPHNANVRPKIRQQLQKLRDHGLVQFLGRGRYRRQSLGRL